MATLELNEIEKAMERLENGPFIYTCHALAGTHFAWERNDLVRRFGRFYEKDTSERWGWGLDYEMCLSPEEKKDRRLTALALFMVAENDV